jgi:hypothetical protein
MGIIKQDKSRPRKALATYAPLLMFCAIAAPTPTRAQHNHELAALSTLQPGQWVLRGLDATSPNKSLCAGNIQMLLRVAHPNASCSQAVISDMADQAIVYYSCPGVGHAQTSLKVETARLVQIESQGVRDNEPFAFSYEARRAGDCAPSGATRPR